MVTPSVRTIIERTRSAFHAALAESGRASEYRLPDINPDAVVLGTRLGGVARSYWTSVIHEAEWEGQRVVAKTYEFSRGEDEHVHAVMARIVRNLWIPEDRVIQHAHLPQHFTFPLAYAATDEALTIVSDRHDATLEELLGAPKHTRLGALGVLAPLSRGIQQFHDAGYEHCDIKPANIGMTKSRASLFDHDMARMHWVSDRAVRSSHDLMRAGFVLGTPAYLPTDLVERPDTRVRPGTRDRYALGVTIGEVVFPEEYLPNAQDGRRTLAERRDGHSRIDDDDVVASAVRRVIARLQSRTDSYATLDDCADDLSAISRGDVERIVRDPAYRRAYDAAYRRGWRTRRSVIVGGLGGLCAIGTAYVAHRRSQKQLARRAAALDASSLESLLDCMVAKVRDDLRVYRVAEAHGKRFPLGTFPDRGGIVMAAGTDWAAGAYLDLLFACWEWKKERVFLDEYVRLADAVTLVIGDRYADNNSEAVGRYASVLEHLPQAITARAQASTTVAPLLRLQAEALDAAAIAVRAVPFRQIRAEYEWSMAPLLCAALAPEYCSYVSRPPGVPDRPQSVTAFLDGAGIDSLDAVVRSTTRHAVVITEALTDASGRSYAQATRTAGGVVRDCVDSDCDQGTPAMVSQFHYMLTLSLQRRERTMRTLLERGNDLSGPTRREVKGAHTLIAARADALLERAVAAGHRVAEYLGQEGPIEPFGAVLCAHAMENAGWVDARDAALRSLLWQSAWHESPTTGLVANVRAYRRQWRGSCVETDAHVLRALRRRWEEARG